MIKWLLLPVLTLAAVACSAPRNNPSYGLAAAEAVQTDTIVQNAFFDMREYQGQTYLNFMRQTIKPAMDQLATNGYAVQAGEAIDRAYELSDRKIRRRVEGPWGGIENVKSIAKSLEGEVVDLHSLPNRIASIDSRIDRYNLATFLGLASGGGVAIQYHEGNYGLNVHYDVKDERSGRSFGVGPTRKANDASDKQYLDDLQDYLSSDKENVLEFYKTMMASLLNADSTNYPQITPEGRTVLTDFLAVFTAEQARNLMDGKIRPHWDAALLEVTLLGAFHAGQDEFKLFYYDRESRTTVFTNETMQQTPCKHPTRTKSASMNDYWQFSRNYQPGPDNAVDTKSKSCRRSGINVTKKRFRNLGKTITGYMHQNHKAKFRQLAKSMGLTKSYNLFESLSYFIISEKTPSKFSDAKIIELSEAWGDFLATVMEDANEITAHIESR